MFSNRCFQSDSWLGWVYFYLYIYIYIKKYDSQKALEGTLTSPHPSAQELDKASTCRLQPGASSLQANAHTHTQVINSQYSKSALPPTQSDVNH